MKTRIREIALMLALMLLIPVGPVLAQEEAERAEELERAERLEQEEMESEEHYEELEEPFLPDAPESLGEMIEIAMDRNPEIRQAEAAVGQAEAELNRVRLEVTREVTDVGRHRLQKLRELGMYAKDAPPPRLRAEIAEVDAELRYLLGLGTEMFEPEPFFHEREAEVLPAQARPGVLGPYEKALETPISVEFEGEQLSEILDFISEYVDVNFIQDIEMPDPEMGLRVEDAALRDCLLAMADQCEYLCFLVRDFGILATTRERAERINAPCIPDDVPLRLAGPLPPQPRPEVDRETETWQALDSPVSLDFGQVQTPLFEILDFLSEYLDVNITAHRDVADLTTSPKLENVPLRAALQSLCDQCEPLCFVVRDYGILATTREHAEGIVAPAIPEDVPLHVPVRVVYQAKEQEPEGEEKE